MFLNFLLDWLQEFIRLSFIFYLSHSQLSHTLYLCYFLSVTFLLAFSRTQIFSLLHYLSLILSLSLSLTFSPSKLLFLTHKHTLSLSHTYTNVLSPIQLSHIFFFTPSHCYLSSFFLLPSFLLPFMLSLHLCFSISQKHTASLSLSDNALKSECLSFFFPLCPCFHPFLHRSLR